MLREVAHFVREIRTFGAEVLYPWGNSVPDKERCNFNLDVGDTTPVGHYPKGASPYGLLDMAGNVWEWTSTKWLDDYKDYAGKVDNSLEGDEFRVLRGGAFDFHDQNVRCAVRLRSNPHDRSGAIGFRVVAPASTSDALASVGSGLLIDEERGSGGGGAGAGPRPSPPQAVEI